MGDIDPRFSELFREIRTHVEKGGARLFPGMVRAFRRDALRWDRAMAQRFSGPLSLDGRKSPSARLASRQGESGLRGSLGTLVRHSGNLGSLELRKFSTSRYAITHEKGTRAAGGTVTLRPKRARALTIPFADALTPSGVQRYPSARDYPGTWIFGDEDAAFIVTSEGDDIVFLFLLFRGEPKIPPRLGMIETHKSGEKKRLADIGKEMARAFGRN